MANQEQVNLLKRSVEEWNQWREKEPDIDINLHQANLSDLSLEGINFKDADLSFANLRNTNLKCADLRAAKCVNTNFERAKLQNSNLGDSSLGSGKHAWFSNTSFQYANLSQTKIQGAVFSETSFANANLEKTAFDECWFKNISFCKANLEKADLSTSSGLLQLVDFSESNLRQADFSGRNYDGRGDFKANLSHCNFRKADLTGVTFANFTLKESTKMVVFEDTNLSKIDFSTLDLSGVEFIRCDFLNSVFCESDLRDSNFFKCNFEQALFWQTKVVSSNFKGSKFTAACIDDWHDNRFTNLDDTTCKYIYFKLGEKGVFSERRPSDPNRNFAHGEFVKLIQKIRETVDLFFREGIDWQAFLTSYQNVQLESDHGELDIRAIEKSS
ncbi:MAG: pentapeptide repeat-containing protein, partial [Limnothrix sp. RL_2_0]|nr:pentapeptide repeat-containing protein [Limnothrix sp. RL_2_0]